MTRFAAVALLLYVSPAIAQRAVFAPVEDDPDLPRVLLIGDSISIGYTLPVRERLAGVANVHRPPTNCGPTTRGLENLEKWLAAENDGGGDWDVIHFNFGLHDLKYVDADGKNTSPGKGELQVPPDEYRANLTKIVERLQKTGAKLIWRPTTPVPAGAKSRVEDAEERYNAIAAEVLDGLGVTVNDLNPIVEADAKLQKPKDVHFTPAGNAALADAVANAIRGALSKRE